MAHLQRGNPRVTPKRQVPRWQMTKGMAFLTAYRLTSLLILFVGLFLAGPFVQVTPASEKVTVILLNAYHKGLAWTDDVTRAVESTLKDHELHVEYMDTKRHADEPYLNLWRDLMFKKYQHLNVDVIISSDDHALSFLLENRDHLFPGVPIVFCGVNDYSEGLLAGHARITGVVEAFDIRQTIGMALHLHPSSRKMVVVNDTTKTGLANRRVIERLLPEFSGQVEFEFLESMTMSEMLSTLQQLPSHTIVLLMSFNRDAAGRVYDYDTSIQLISEKCRVPIYGIWDFYLGKGIVGGKLTSGTAQGEAAAAIALKIIGGTRADDIPVVTQSPNRWMFDDRQLLRFNIDESRLPVGSEIVNRPWSVYREYKTIIWITVAALFVMASLSIFLLMNIENRRKAEKKLRKSERQMSQIINFLPDPTFVIDRKSRIIAWNRAMEDLTGIKADAMLGKGNYEYAIPFYGERRPVMIDLVGSWSDQIASQYKDIEKKGDLLFSETLEPHRPLGNRHFRNTAGPLYDENGMVVGAIETINDITDRRHAEASLRLMDHVVQNSPVVLFRWQATENWPVDYVTDNVDQFGYTKEELLSGKVPFSAMIHPDDRSRVTEEVMAYSRQGVFDFKQEYRIVTKDGAVRWIDDRTVVERDGHGTITHYQGVVLDITDRKLAQEEISKRQLYLESVLYHAPDAIVTLDAHHRVEDWNPGAEKIFGYTSQEARGNELDSLVTRDEARAEAGRKTRRVLSGERVEAFETVRFRKDGTPVHVIAGGSPIMVDGTLRGVVAMYTDVTALKQAQDDVRRNERMLRRIMDIVPSMIFVKNERGRFLMVNQAVAEAYGMTVDDLISMPHELVHPDPTQVQGYLADDREAMESGRSLSVSEEPFQDHTGATRWLEVIKVPGDADDFGEPVIVGLATDITERRAVEARIQESEKRYRTMFENTGTGTVLSEADTTLSMVNSEFASMVGYPRDEIEGKMSWTQFIVPEDVGRMKTYHFARREDPTSAPTQWECSLVDRSGTVKRMLLKVRLIPGTRTSIGSFLDITERKQAEEAVVEANRMLRLVLDTIPVRVFWKDRACRYEGCNQAFAEDAGQSAPEDLIGKDDYAMGWIDQADLYREDDLRVMDDGDARINYEEPQTTPDGRTIWLQTSKVPMRDGQGNVIGVLGTYQDITERKAAVEELRRLRNYLTNIINSMPSILVGVDLEGRVTQWNSQAELATGMTFDTVRSQPLAEVFPRLMDEMTRIRSAIHERRVLHDPKIPRHSNGETRFEDVTIFPLVANGVEGAVIRVDDVTERVRLEEMMIQSEKMLSVGGLAAGMAHEINNPLAGILQNAAVLDSRLFGDLPANRKAAEAAGTTMASIRRYLELRKLPTMLDNIRTSGNRAAAIVKNMLSFARKSDRIISSHDLGSLLDQTLELAKTDYDMKKHYDFKQIRIIREYDAGTVSVPCEASKLQQVFLNILKNGAEAMTEGMDGPAPPAFTLRVKDDGSWMRVEIEDNGPGMNEKTRRRIFEPFFTTKPVGSGTGLGLSVSYFIITENHGGKMDVHAAEGGGTRFIIRLPKKGKPR
jgi:PAS domain S-box-containing protein